MKNMNKKGQHAMEHLMTYGWAILIVLVVGSVLLQMGVYSELVGGYGSDRSIGFTNTKVGIIDASIKCSVSENLSFFITNQAGATLVNVNVAGGGVCNGSDAAVLSPGEKAKIGIDCNFIKDEKVDFPVTMDFTEKIAGEIISRSISGRIICTGE